MKIIAQLILITGVIKYSCKASFFRAYRGIIAFTLLVGAIAMVSYPYILKTDSDVFTQLLSNKKVVSNIAVVLTIEAISGMLISIGMLHNLFESKTKKWTRILKFTPGLLIFGIVFYIELSLFQILVGYSFSSIAIVAVCLSMLVVLILSVVIKKLLPHYSDRYELKFLINLVLLILSILLHAGLADYNTASYNSQPTHYQFFAILGVIIFGFVSGLFLYKNRKILNKLNKK